jgi:hypothetical protein
MEEQMNKLVVLFFLLVSFNLLANSSGTFPIKGFVLEDGAKIFINKEVKELVFDKDKKIESIELRSGHIIDPIEVKSVILNKSLMELSNLNESGSRFVHGGDGSGGG